MTNIARGEEAFKGLPSAAWAEDHRWRMRCLRLRLIRARAARLKAMYTAARTPA